MDEIVQSINNLSVEMRKTDWVAIIGCIATIIAAIAAIKAVCVTRKIAEQQNKMIQSQYNSLHRPIISAYPTKTIEGKFAIELKNIGDSAAKNIQINFPDGENICNSFQENIQNFISKTKAKSAEIQPNQIIYFVLDRNSLNSSINTFFRKGTIFWRSNMKI